MTQPPGPETRPQDVGFTREALPSSHHVCLVYDSEEERQRVVSAFLRAGLVQRELVSYFADTTDAETIRAWVRQTGVDLEDAERREAFRIVPASAAYCPQGSFDPEEVIARILKRYEDAAQAGHTGSRVGAEMTWALRGLPGSERVLEYEARLNTISTTFPHVGMCQYDARRFDGATLFQVLQLHPFMVSQGQIVRNPYYTRATEFLKDGA